MKNTRNINILVYALVGLALALLFWLPSEEENKIEVNVSLYSDNEGRREWSPGLSLSAGTYNMGVVIENNDSGALNEVEFWTIDQGVVYTGQIDAANYSTWFTVTLDNPSNILYVRTIGSEEGSITVRQVVAESMNGSIYHDAAFFTVIFAILYALFGLYLFSDKAVSSQIYGYAAILGAVILASYLLFKPYLTAGHDIRFHLYRIESIKDALLAGQFPVRLHPTFNYGYGYATATVYPELFLYIPAVLRILGVSIPTTYQFFLFLINLATAWIMYYSVRSVTKSNFAAVTASVAYTLFPYRLVCLYERAAVGEALGMCFIPLVIAGIYHVFLKKS